MKPRNAGGEAPPSQRGALPCPGQDAPTEGRSPTSPGTHRAPGTGKSGTGAEPRSTRAEREPGAQGAEPLSVARRAARPQVAKGRSPCGNGERAGRASPGPPDNAKGHPGRSRSSLPRKMGGGGCQPISSNALPLVSLTYLSTKGIESTAKTV
ncbi:hypothetical protein GCM10020221_24560 [Streptomyces thioluteus]|uniref:Uncharacterized protein n=1 Tax=Streptomyces thioluteus TaxID=66431 RepID=A0ABP6JDY5_STRTU